MDRHISPFANPESVLVFGKTRIQILTDRLVRFEWAEDGVFEDRATLAVSNRLLPSPAFTKKIEGKRAVIRTSHLAIEHVADGRRLSRENLRVTFSLAGRKVSWHPGQKDIKNLKGTYRTLDGVAGGQCRLGDGLVSRSGWAVHDDGGNIVIDTAKVKTGWAAARPAGGRQDIYLFAYGSDYKAAVRDAALVFGGQPLPPRFAFGYWWSRYWAYSDKDLESLVEDFDRRGLPLDVLVVDMDWHLPNWTGYTWDKTYFPDWREFLGWCKRKGLKITLNLHPAAGVRKYEEQFPAMCKALGLDPKATREIPFDCADPAYMRAYFDVLHHPYENAGVDFWWMDWQQGTETKVAGLDPLPWLNRLHWDDMERRSLRKRPLIFSRYGGPGSGRYPIGFSGDTIIRWKTLAFQPYFTATAANVLYGYWSHDIGGHFHQGAFKTPRNDPELYMRWLQFGAYSPILRSHASKVNGGERRVWEYSEPYSRAMMDALKLRYELVPYIYTECRKGCETGMSLCRPLYYEYPGEEAAYEAKGQYFFGSEMLAAPVTAKAGRRDGLARARIWLPPGQWFDTALGKMDAGGRWIERSYSVSEIPVFVRPGAIIPGRRGARRILPGSYKDLVVTVYPGGRGSYDLYEDDGESQDYLAGRSAVIPLSHEKRGASRRIVIGKASGSFRGFIGKRSLEIRLPGTTPPLVVSAAGRRLEWRYRLGAEGWTYDGKSATTIIRLAGFDAAKGVVVETRGRDGLPDSLADGFKGLMARLEEVRALVTSAGCAGILHLRERLAPDAAQTANRISRDPATMPAELRKLAASLRALPRVLEEMKKPRRKSKRKDALASLRKRKMKDALAALRKAGNVLKAIKGL